MHPDTPFFASLAVLTTPSIDIEYHINWACELLELGYDTYHLRILAGLTPNQDVTPDVLGRVFNELQIVYPSKEEAKLIYLKGLLERYLQKKIPRYVLLTHLFYLCECNDHHYLFFPFWDLSYEESNVNASSPGMYYEGLGSFDRLDECTQLEVMKLLYFLENEDKKIVSQTLSTLNF